MISIEISIDRGGFDPQGIIKEIEHRQGLNASMGEGMLQEVRDHLDRNYVPRNKRGDFWADVRNSAEVEIDDDGATVSLQQLGLSLRFRGGEVTPGKSISSYTGKTTVTLAVPSAAVPVQGGRQIRPGRAGLLAFIRKAQGGETRGFLVEAEERAITRGPSKGQSRLVPRPGGALMYTLRTITRHKADPRIIPTDARLIEVATAAAKSYVESFAED